MTWDRERAMDEIDPRDLYDDDENVECETCGYRWHSRIIPASRYSPREYVDADCPRCELGRVPNETYTYRVTVVAPVSQEEMEKIWDRLINFGEQEPFKIDFEVEQI
jgi:DNA-directed RNA polymerase subunit RPC12/RpoP